MMRKSTARWVAAALVAVFGVLFVWPVARVLSGGFFEEGRFTLRFLAGVFRNPIYAEGLRNSLTIACGTTALALLIALPLALLAHRFEFRGKRWLSAVLLVPMILPPFVGAIGFQQILGQYGALNAALGLGPVDWLGRARLPGVVLLQALSLYPIVYLNVSAALANVDPAMEEAARNLGANAARRLLRITLPLILPGLFAGGTIVFIWSFTELGTPLMLNYTRCAPVQVYDALKEIAVNPFPYALVFVMLSCSVLLYAASKLLFGRGVYALSAKSTSGRTPDRLRGWRGAAVAAPFVGVAALALLPHAGVVLTSLSVPGAWYGSVLPSQFTAANYADALGHSMTLSGIRNSLLFSSLAVVANIVLGLTAAFVIARSTTRLRHAVDALAMAPLAVPGLVMAFGFLSVSSLLANLPAVRDSAWLTSLVDVRTNPTLFLVVAYAVRRMPYLVRAAVAGLQQTPVTLEEAAANLGAPPLSALRRVTLPLISANVIAGALLAFAFCMLEVSDSLMLAQREDFYPITKTIYELNQLIGTGRYAASALGVWGMAFLGVTILGSSLILGKRLGALFRV
jgi:iron(III) transport system permease protein